MATPTPEQMAEFKRWEESQKGPAATPDVIKGVIEDDVREAEGLENKRAAGRANREYTAKFIPTVAKRELAEEEHHHKEE
jgi:hypothetical protein